MEHKIGKKKFKIERVSILVAELYSEVVEMAYGYQDIKNRLEEIDLECQVEIAESDSVLEITKAKLRRLRALAEAKKEGPELTKRIYEKRFEALRELLELNGYKYDEEFWRRDAAVEDVNDILVGAVGGGVKKKLASA